MVTSEPDRSETSVEVATNAASSVDGVQFNDDGLVPVITQDAATNRVLMLAWMNAEALSATLRTRRATYFSRSRQEQWVKGETSGNRQEVVSLARDCDGDTLLLVVNQTGPACHTGTETCFTGREIPLPSEEA